MKIHDFPDHIPLDVKRDASIVKQIKQEMEASLFKMDDLKILVDNTGEDWENIFSDRDRKEVAIHLTVQYFLKKRELGKLIKETQARCGKQFPSDGLIQQLHSIGFFHKPTEDEEASSVNKENEIHETPFALNGQTEVAVSVQKNKGKVVGIEIGTLVIEQPLSSSALGKMNRKPDNLADETKAPRKIAKISIILGIVLLILAMIIFRYCCSQGIKGFTYLRTATYSCGGRSYTVEEYFHKQTGLEFVLIPGGSFIMGSMGGYACEQPMYRITVRPFLISKYEITQKVWQKVMGSIPPQHNPGENRPVGHINWTDCQEFCKKTETELPSEAQWEYACRAGTTTKYYWGNEMDGNYIWYVKNSGYYSQPVGTKYPNAFGLYDMLGNIWEWCQDRFHENYQGLPTDGTPWESGDNICRVLRGGSCDNPEEFCRCSKRNWYPFNTNDRRFGLRVVKNLETKKQ